MPFELKVPSLPPLTPFAKAVETLRRLGYTVVPASMMGLVIVDGQELTIADVIGFAATLIDPLI